MGISAQFGIENYEWRLGIDQNVCEYCVDTIRLKCVNSLCNQYV